jgi:hypothetical protein
MDKSKYSENCTFRGLERHMDRRSSRERKKNGWSVLLDEQLLQLEFGYHEPESIADLYACASHPSLTEALSKGFEDEQEAKKVYTRIMIMLRGRQRLKEKVDVGFLALAGALDTFSLR